MDRYSMRVESVAYGDESEPRCYHCQTVLGDINAACPNCLPNWIHAAPQPDAPVSWEEQQYLDVKHENDALREDVARLRGLLQQVVTRGREGTLTMCCPGDDAFELRMEIQTALTQGKGGVE